MTFRRPILRKVTGYPAGLEAVMFMIQEGKTESRAFVYALDHCSLTEEEAWAIYQDWCEHKIHPKVRDIVKRLFGT